MKLKSIIIGIIIVNVSCMGNVEKTNIENKICKNDNMINESSWQSMYYSVKPTDLSDNVIKLIGKEWMLVTAGNDSSFNTMTASWGGMGYIWERPATFIFIRNIRYTYQFLLREESFTLSFFSENYRNALQICGTKSGRDTDKVKEAGLTPIQTPSCLMSFKEARMIIECKKMLVQELDYNNFVENYKSKIINQAYTADTSKHQMFISEIVNIWIKK